MCDAFSHIIYACSVFFSLSFFFLLFIIPIACFISRLCKNWQKACVVRAREFCQNEIYCCLTPGAEQFRARARASMRNIADVNMFRWRNILDVTTANKATYTPTNDSEHKLWGQYYGWQLPNQISGKWMCFMDEYGQFSRTGAQCQYDTECLSILSDSTNFMER